MLVVKVDVFGDIVLARALSRFGENVRDFSPVLEEIHDAFIQIEQEQFDTQGGRSNPWEPLRPTYAQWKQKYFPGLPILVLTGALRSEMVNPQTEITPHTLRMSPYNDLKAIFHQKGRADMAARPVIDLTEADKLDWMKRIHRFIYEKAKEGGLTP